MRDHFRIGLAAEHIAFGLQFGTQFVVVFNDAVVHQSHPARLAIQAVQIAGARAEMGVRIVYRWGTMRCPTGVCNARSAFQMISFNLRHQF